MKRLTERDWKDKCAGYLWSVHPVKDIDDLPYYKKLAAYEDAEEQGLLLRLPCKVGDTVFADSGCFGILEYEVDEIIIEKSITYRCSAYSETIGDCPSECLDEIEPDISYFGKTVFLTRGEAEAKLKEMEESHG